MRKIYLASPLGFSVEMKPYLEKITARLVQLGCEVFDPWGLPFREVLREASRIETYRERIACFTRIAKEIGEANENGIVSSDIVLGVLDGVEVDSGTASEIGFAAGIGRRCFGLRTDWRDSGDFHGVPINLQVLWFIERSGGKLFRSIQEIVF